MSKRTILFALTLLALLGTVSVMTACNTMAGAGEDMSSAGHVITGDANRSNPGH
jgi:entericidin B